MSVAICSSFWVMASVKFKILPLLKGFSAKALAARPRIPTQVLAIFARVADVLKDAHSCER